MNLPSEPGLQRRLIYGNVVNYINTTKFSNVSLQNLLNKSKLITTQNNLHSCSLCLNTITPNSIIRILNCNHLFHYHCIDTFLIKNNHCPLCKYLISDKSYKIPIISIQKLLKNTYLRITTIHCSICLDISHSDIIRFLHCNHCFHSICIDSWLVNNNSCPLCRIPI